MRIGIITYATNHLKTEQVAVGLKQRGYDDIHLFALPFNPRPARKIVFAHRPDMMIGGDTKAIAKSIGAGFEDVASAGDIPPDGADIFLIGGAGLLPPSFVNATLGRVLNSHPGKIPFVRGLDAFKWAILDQQPIENSLHFIDAETDAGEMIAQFQTPCFVNDTLEKLAARHYEIEIDMMIDFEMHVNLYRAGDLVFPEVEPRPARMRMKAADQHKLRDAFEQYKEIYAVDA